jgi:UDP-glucose 4-epimerase|tara:strand:+ start:2110 stop:3033 length:924 start_codon:yes stop_codon:yes gene_type:complete
MKIIVTGGAGFVGSHLVELLIKKKHFPIIVDNLNSGVYSNIKKFVDSKKAKFIKCDIRNFKKVIQLPQVDAIMHLAAIASVVESIDNPIFVNDVNITGTLNILEFCRKKKIKKLVFTSSAAIYGDYEKNITEISPTIPTTVYGSTKLTGEQYCKIYSNLFGINTTILRPFNIYGPRQNNAYAGVISKFMDRLNDNKSPIIFGDGKQTRDFIHVYDVVDAFYFALMYKKKKFDVFNLATGKSTTVNNLAKFFLLSTKKLHLQPIHKKSVPGVVVNSSTNPNKIKQNLKFSSKITLKDGINTYVQSQSN